MVFLKLTYVNTCFIVSYVFLKCWMEELEEKSPFEAYPLMFFLK